MTRTYLYLISAAVVVLDRLTKWAVVSNVALYDSVTVVKGVFNIVHWHNDGAAFDLLGQSVARWKLNLLIGFSLIAIFTVSVLIWKTRDPLTSTAISLSLVLGGALGNLLDRVVGGHVVDFLDFYVGSHHWPAFNLADSAIVTGATLLAWKLCLVKPNQAVTNNP